MNEIEIQTFLAVIDSGSISAAAKTLYLTQPAISRRIRILEESLGYPLIVRGQGERNITLTEQGKVFAGYAEKISTLFKNVHEMSRNTRQHQINLASPAVIDTNRIVNAICNYKRLYPESTFILHTRHSYDAASGVNNGNLDFAIVTRLTHVSKINYVPISSEPYKLITHRHYKPEIRNLMPKDLDSDREIKMPWDLAYESWHSYWLGDDTMPFIKVDRLSAVSLFLKEAEGWSLLPESIANNVCKDPDFIPRSLSDLPTDITLYLIQKKYSADSQLLIDFSSCFSMSEVK